MTTYPSELKQMFREIEAERKPKPEALRRYECDCGRIFSHPDQLIACANARHR